MIQKKTKTTLLCTCEIPSCGKSWESQGEKPPKVCRWCYSRRWNGQDLRHTHLVTANGKTQAISAWAKETGIGKATIRARLNAGWTTEEAVGFVKHERKKHEPRSRVSKEDR